MSTTILAQTPPSQPSDCKIGCTSNDVQIQRAYLVDMNGVELPPNFICTNTTSVKLALDLTTKTPRVGVTVYANIKSFIGGIVGTTPLKTVKECFGIALNQPTNKVVFSQSFGWACGTRIVLTDVFIGWGTGNTNFCTGTSFQCPATSSKCFSLPPGEYITVQTPTANPTAATKCSTTILQGIPAATFNLPDLEGDVKGAQTNVTVEWFLDEALANPVSSSSSFTTGTRDVWAKVRSTIPPNPETKIKITLTVNQTPDLTITDPVAVCSPSTVNLTTEAVTLGSTLPAGTALSYWTNVGATSSLSSPDAITASGTYYIKATTNTNPACTDIKSVTVTVNEKPATPDLTVVQPTCANANGTVTITSPTGADYEYSNGGAFQASPVFTVVAGASYSITVKKLSSGCISTAKTGAMGSQPITPAAPDLTVVQPTCANANGTVTVTSPLGADYLYSNGGAYQATTSFTVAANAAYNITVKKLSSGCISLVTSGTMGAQPITPAAPDLTVVQPTCANANGTVTVTSPLGADYQYSNGGAYQATTSFTVAANAAYNITVKKLSSGCISLVTSGTMGAQPITPAAPDLTVVQPTCANANGTVTVTSPLGADYQYSNGAAYQATTSFTVAANAAYNITVKKLSSGCISLVTSGTMGAQPITPAAPTFCIVQPSTLCNANAEDGSVTINSPCGVDYEYSIKDGESGSWQSSIHFDNLKPGDVTGIRVRDKNIGCVSDASSCNASDCSVSPCPPIPPANGKTVNPDTKKTTSAIAPVETTTASKTETAGFDAYPVPFKDQLTIKYKFDYVSDVKIEVFNAQGISILSKTDTNSYLNKEIALDLKLNKGKEQLYMVKVSTNRGSSVKKIISSK
ncbi:T9SS type A sorting domain-containing protein [Flavobacterium fluvii]|nr:T9SS type A sorting domain-containing protein [Flavobacterium fluvii]